MAYSREQFEFYMAERARLEAEIFKLKEAQRELLEKIREEKARKLEDIYKEEAADISKWVCAERGLDDSVVPIVNKELGEEAKRLAFFYEKQFGQGMKSVLGKMAIFSRNIAMGTMTMGDIWHQMWSNLFSIIFGPWVIGSFFVFLQFLLVSNYVPNTAPKAFLQIMAPMIVGGGVFFLNFMSSKNPMDWLTHIVSGFLIAYTFAILWIGIFASMEGFPGGIMWFWIIWGLSSFFIGIFSLYQLGGFRAVMQFAVIVLLFGYLALGPYKAAYREAIDKVKEPFTLAFRAVINAFKDAWILAINPTEWYARQQLRNARSEQPLELPKGVEIVRLESLTPNLGIPHGEEFEIFAIIQNSGKLDAKNVKVGIKCNEFCEIRGTRMLLPSKLPLSKDAIGMEDLDEMPPGKQAQLRFNKIYATKPGRSAYEIAKVTLNVSYEYSTNTTLPVTISSDAEISRRLSTKEEVFKPVVSRAMDGPAQISLNVGPQPLRTGRDTTLLVAVINARPDGVVVLNNKAKLLIDVPESVGTITPADASNVCRSRNVDCVKVIKDGKDKIECTVNPKDVEGDLRITSGDFSSVLPVFCEFNGTSEKNISIFKTGSISTELQNYVYEVKKVLDVTVTQPLGVAKASPRPT